MIQLYRYCKWWVKYSMCLETVYRCTLFLTYTIYLSLRTHFTEGTFSWNHCKTNIVKNYLLNNQLWLNVSTNKISLRSWLSLRYHAKKEGHTSFVEDWGVILVKWEKVDFWNMYSYPMKLRKSWRGLIKKILIVWLGQTDKIFIIFLHICNIYIYYSRGEIPSLFF